MKTAESDQLTGIAAGLSLPGRGPTLVKFQRWMKCLATSRAALPCTTEAMSCQGILGVVCLSMKSAEAERREGRRLREAGLRSRRHQPTVKRFVQLDPVLVHKVAVVFPVPEARVSEQFCHPCVHTGNRVLS